MNKKLLTAAIAAVIAAPTAALANDVTIYGVIHASVDYLDSDFSSKGGVREYGDAIEGLGYYTAGFDDAGMLDGFDVASRATRIGFKGSEDLANGLKAIWKIEAQADIADNGSCSVPSFVGPYGGQSPTLGQGNTGSGPQIARLGGSLRNQWRSYTTNNPNVVGGLAYYDYDLDEYVPTPAGAAVAASADGSRPVCQSGDWWTARNAYIGLAGGWGTFLVGRHDTPFKMSTGKLDLFADTLADYNSTIGFVDIRTNSAIAYVSPSWSGLSFAGAMVAPHVYNGGTGNEIADADGLAEAYSLALTYDNAGFFGTVAYENVSQDWISAWASLPSSGLPSYVPADSDTTFSSIDDNSKWRVGLGWTGAGFTIGGVYEWEDNLIGYEKGTDGERWQIQAGYTFGNNMIKAMYGQGDYTAPWVRYDNTGRVQRQDTWDADQSAWAIGVDHNFSKRTKAYILYTNVDYSQSYDQKTRPGGSTGGDGSFSWANTARANLDGNAGGFSLGMIHSF